MDQLPSIGARKEETQQLRQQRTGHVGFASPHPVPPGQPVPPAISLVTCRGVRTPAVSLVFTQAASQPHHPRELWNPGLASLVPPGTQPTLVPWVS